MAKVAQGTALYWIKDATTVQKVFATKISGISAQRDPLETTDLGEVAKTFLPGLMSPGSATFDIYFDPSIGAHNELHAAYVAGTTMKWAVGWSDGTTDPTATSGEFTLPDTRTFCGGAGKLDSWIS